MGYSFPGFPDESLETPIAFGDGHIKVRNM
jgi:hypothetical protein